MTSWHKYLTGILKQDPSNNHTCSLTQLCCKILVVIFIFTYFQILESKMRNWDGPCRPSGVLHLFRAGENRLGPFSFAKTSMRMFFPSAGWVKQGAPLPAHLLYKMSEGKKSRDENCWDPSWPKLLQDIYQKKSELLCPECRKPVEVAIDSLPPNILANRILEVIKLKSCWVQIFYSP